MKSASSAEDEQWHRMNMFKTWVTMPGLVVALSTCVDTNCVSLSRVQEKPRPCETIASSGLRNNKLRIGTIIKIMIP